MLQYLENNKSLVSAQNLQNKETHRERKEKCDELAMLLNAEVGATKTTPQWQKCWSDEKCKTKQLAGEEKMLNKTEGGPSTGMSKNDQQRRVITLIGSDSVEGCGPKASVKTPL